MEHVGWQTATASAVKPLYDLRGKVTYRVGSMWIGTHTHTHMLPTCMVYYGIKWFCIFFFMVLYVLYGLIRMIMGWFWHIDGYTLWWWLTDALLGHRKSEFCLKKWFSVVINMWVYQNPHPNTMTNTLQCDHCEGITVSLILAACRDRSKLKQQTKKCSHSAKIPTCSCSQDPVDQSHCCLMLLDAAWLFVTVCFDLPPKQIVTVV